MLKKALLKDSIKEIKNTFKRFLSLLLMAFLGVGFFAGIRATSPDMVDTIDTYYKQQKMYDIQILSTLGLTENDINSIKEIDGVDIVEGTYETDGIVEIENKEIITKVLCIDELNKPLLVEGELPQNSNECIVEENFLKYNNKAIGDTITIEVENTKNDNGEEVEYLYNKELKIVGTAKSPLYISNERGNSTLGDGKVDYYIYISKDNIQAKDVYTNIYVTLKNVEKYETASSKYENIVEDVTNKIKNIKEERENARHDELVQKATDKVNDAQKEFDEKKQEANEQITEAQKKIDDGKAEIESSEAEIKENEKKANSEFTNAEKQIASAKQEIQANEITLQTKEQEANSQISELETQKQGLIGQRDSLNNQLVSLKNTYNTILENLKNEGLDDKTKEELEKQKQQLESQIQTINNTITSLNSGITQIEQGINQANTQIQQAKEQLQIAKNQLSAQEKKLNQQKSSTYTQLENAKSQIEQAKIDLQNGEKELETQKQDVEKQLQDAEKELIDARQKISEIENPEWYILDRYANAGYSGFAQDKESVYNIGQVFPIVFFLVAVLISLTSMTRMVEEQRTQIGTLKALGYNKVQIAGKYILYSSLASVIGGLLGMNVGFILIPSLIWRMYEVVYQVPEFIISFNWEYSGAGLILISACIIGATIYSCIRELRHQPATLMRPKAPKIGKRVLLERINFIWKRLSFSQKVTIRNIFRYKKRFMMTIIGILGCTSLILAGFGLKDSIGSLMPNQYGKIFKYDMQINLKEGLDDTQKNEYITELEQNELIKETLETQIFTRTAVNGENEEDVQIIIPKNQNELEEMISLIDVNSEEKIQLQKGQIVITDKLAELLNVKQGDKITLRSDDEEKEAIISNVAENYVYHYVYMTKETYEELFGKQFVTNAILTQNAELNEEQEENLATEIMNQNEVSSLTRNSNVEEVMNTTMESLNYIVVVLIVSAGLLAFAVLYNLSNVNISERIRELATIKVLGFYDNEVYTYVTRETILLTIIGIIIGLLGGYFLNYFIIGTCEIDILRFSKIVHPLSYLYSILITVAFTVIVNIFTYFALKKIDMIESLKSIE